MNTKPAPETSLLRIYVGSTDLVRRTPVYEAIAYAARRYGMEGCTVTKGLMGYGTRMRLSSPKFWEMVEKVPVVVEIADDSARIEAFLDKISCWLDRLPHGCFVVTLPAAIRRPNGNA